MPKPHARVYQAAFPPTLCRAQYFPPYAENDLTYNLMAKGDYGHTELHNDRQDRKVGEP